MLGRLYGFYVPFETALGVKPERSLWLAADLRGLGGAAPDDLPLCRLPRYDTPQRRVGADYVAEGSALGGAQLNRSLEALLGPGGSGRRFFQGRGAGAGAAWRSFLSRLESFAGDPAGHGDIVAGAVETFQTFELWLAGWK